MIRVLRDMNPAAILELRASPLGQAVTDQRIWDLNKSLSAGEIHWASEHTDQSRTIRHSKLKMMANDDPRCSGSLCGNGVIDIDGFNQEKCDDGMMIPQTAAPTSAS